MYRLLRTHTVRCREGDHSHQLRLGRLLADGSQSAVVMWDITKLPSPRKWTLFTCTPCSAYSARYVGGWMVAERESSALAEQLISERGRQGSVSVSSRCMRTVAHRCAPNRWHSCWRIWEGP